MTVVVHGGYGAIVATSVGGASDPPTDGGAMSVIGLRRRGIAMLAVAGWLAWAGIALVALFSPQAGWSVVAFGALVNVGPTAMALRRRHDGEARMIAATLAAFMPALLVFVLRESEWQMDAHMYFFVALAALTVLCDWRPIALASAMIAAHHLLLEWVAPSWVFDGPGNLGRVIFHAVAVGLQFVVLAYVTRRLAELLTAQDRAVEASARLTAVAQGERARAQEALAAVELAEAAAARARADIRAAEVRHAEARRTELLGLAADFERSVTSIAVAIEASSGQLEDHAANLDELACAAGRKASDVGVNAGLASDEIRKVAEAIGTLSGSIGSIASAAERQRGLSELGQQKGGRSTATIARLNARADEIVGFIDQIRGIASRTNLLALNATIEAARAGAAGAGFVVVAQEVKVLAGESARASDRIIELVGDIRATMEDSRNDVAQVNAAVAEVSAAATGIAAKTAGQRILASHIEEGATRAAHSAELIEGRIAELVVGVAAAVQLSTQVRDNTSALSVNARDLRGSSERFVRHLRENPVAA